jgi:hypothetical protein
MADADSELQADSYVSHRVHGEEMYGRYSTGATSEVPGLGTFVTGEEPAEPVVGKYTRAE